MECRWSDRIQNISNSLPSARPQAPICPNLELGSRPQNRRLDHNTTKNKAMMPLMVMMILTNVLNSFSNPIKKSRPEPQPFCVSDQRGIYSDFALQNKRQKAKATITYQHFSFEFSLTSRMRKNHKGWGLSEKLGKHSAIWGKLGTALQAYTLNPCTKFPPNPTSRKVNT